MPSFTQRIKDMTEKGPIIEIAVSLPPPILEVYHQMKKTPQPAIKIKALIDTGASTTVVQSWIPNKLGLTAIDNVYIHTPTSTNYSTGRYYAAIILPNNVLVETEDLITAPLEKQEIQCLIGRDILKHGILIYNGYTNLISLSF